MSTRARPYRYAHNRLGNLIVATLYSDGELTRDTDGIGFACPNPILFHIQRVETLEELKHIILWTMGAVGQKFVKRVAYRFLDLLPPLEYKFKLFWLEGDNHVRAMFELHHRYVPHQVMELLAETWNVGRCESGPSSSRPCPTSAILAPPLRIATPDVTMEMNSDSGDVSDGEYIDDTESSSKSFVEAQFVPETQPVRTFLLSTTALIPDLSFVSCHFHTLHLDAMREEPIDGFGGGGQYYINLDEGKNFMVEHHFNCQEAVYLTMKNYNIRNAAEYRILESNQYMYVCRCKQSDVGCPWSIRVALRINLEYW
ncbi:hypothetical protein PIB30_013519 [Stylosanthes scabra]|uniref:Transposase MuDR plant domain-containing protein n=1 Tax=Stylosanthes scabra TaxID=79078 RepID=A0ABU6Q6D9_9FABA|nr:hypothetical protein [Stylosanthes scabra]